MGMSLDVTLGLGVEIPIEEDGLSSDLAEKIVSSIGENPDFISEIEEYDDEVYTTYDTYEIFDALGKKFPLLSFELGYAHDYKTAAAILISRLSDSGYYESASLDPSDLTPTEDEMTQLQEALKIFGLEGEDLKIISFPSYG